jgi:hypothetical protein
MTDFIDFLNLNKIDLSKKNLVLFYWKSWWWKSTYLKNLLEREVYKNNFVYLFHKDEKITYKKLIEKYIFIDEIASAYWFYVVIRYLLLWKKLLVATHIHPIFYSFLRLFYNCSFYFTDKNNHKIETILKQKWFIYDGISINDFIKKYKWNFVDLEIILETAKSNNKNFHQIFYTFEKNNQIKYNTLQ